MESVAYLDTHLVVWLFAGKTELLTDTVRASIDNNNLRISPMVVLELQYLQEIGRVSASPENILSELQSSVGLQVCELPFQEVIKQAVPLNWTRDPFDRIIVAQATTAGADLLTRDKTVHTHFARAVW